VAAMVLSGDFVSGSGQSRWTRDSFSDRTVHSGISPHPHSDRQVGIVEAPGIGQAPSHLLVLNFMIVPNPGVSPPSARPSYRSALFWT
jgi:hypothetical protein